MPVREFKRGEAPLFYFPLSFGWLRTGSLVKEGGQGDGLILCFSPGLKL
jgi:hypothetical protein